MKEIAKTPQARFEWYIQNKFSVLPTDSRWTDLTQEQLDLMMEHFLLDNPPKVSAYTDADYDKEEDKVEGYDGQKAKEEGRLPIQDHESYNDPDFDAEWNTQDEVSNSDIVGEKSSEDNFEILGETPDDDIKKGIDLNKADEWEEV